MDIEGAPTGKAVVRFDSFDERYEFGWGAPFWSAEHQRAINYTTRGAWTVGLLRQYSSEESEYPQAITTKLQTLGAVAGRLCMELNSPHITEEHRQATQQMLATIANFFESQALEQQG